MGVEEVLLLGVELLCDDWDNDALDDALKPLWVAAAFVIGCVVDSVGVDDGWLRGENCFGCCCCD